MKKIIPLFKNISIIIVYYQLYILTGFLQPVRIERLKKAIKFFINKIS